MQRQINSWFWMFWIAGGMMMASAGVARADLTICGVDVGYQRRCYKELKRLVEACKSTPTICGRSYRDGSSPSLQSVRRRCKRMYRSQRRRWRESLCGVRLFSRPHTYCGLRGMQVAVACIKQQGKDRKPAVGGVKAVDRSQPVAPTPPRSPAAKAQAPAPRTASSQTVRASAPASPRAAAATSKRPVTGLVNAVKPPTLEGQGQGSSNFWLAALQVLTLGLVFLLFWRRRERNHARPWEQRRWSEVDDAWGVVPEPEPAQVDLGGLELTLEQIELRLQVWEEQWREAQREHDPIVSLQRWGDSLRTYYCKLAEEIASKRGRQSVSRVQRRLLEARDKIRWLFQAHREPPAQALLVEQLKEELLERTEQLLQQMGYLDGQQQIPQLLAQGEFSVEDFLARKAEDQAQRFLQDESLQNFSAIRNEYLQRLEQLYRSNLSVLVQTESEEAAVATIDQQQIYTEQYILQFLLHDLPQRMERYSRQSNRDRCGALLEQLFQFIDDELKESGLVLFPILDEKAFISGNAKFMYLARAGVCLAEQPNMVLRDAETSLLQATEHVTPPPSKVEQVAVSENTAEYTSHAPEESSQEGMVGVAVARAVSPSDNTAAYSQDLFDDIDQVIMSYDKESERSIANPDSDPPTAEVTTDMQHRKGQAEGLPMGPLPSLEGGNGAAKGARKRDKITEEYGPITHDSELPYSLNPQHPSKEPS